MDNAAVKKAWEEYNAEHPAEWQDWAIHAGYVTFLTWYTARNWNKHGIIGKLMIGFLWSLKVQTTIGFLKESNATH